MPDYQQDAIDYLELALAKAKSGDTEGAYRDSELALDRLGTLKDEGTPPQKQA